jgi:hypothetical protein
MPISPHANKIVLPFPSASKPQINTQENEHIISLHNSKEYNLGSNESIEIL